MGDSVRMLWEVRLEASGEGLSLMTSLRPVGPDQSVNSGSERFSGFSNLFAKWDVSTGAGQG